MSRKYVECDCCQKKIYLGEEAYFYDGLCGIFCSSECFCDAHATVKVVTKYQASNCYHEVYTEMVGEDK
jgi:hypothetical protein